MRNNLDRLGLDVKKPQNEDVAAALGLNFVVPTEIVDLPSKGIFYSEEHPLHGKDTIEIRYMTAKDEDTLTNQSLLKKGIALQKVLEDLVIDKTIKLESLLVGDKSAIVLAARKTAYGTDYDTKIICPSCSKVQNYKFNLNECSVKDIISQDELDEIGVTRTGGSTFMFDLPILNVPVEIKLLTGKDELFLSQRIREAQQSKKDIDIVLLQLRTMIKSLNGRTEQNIISDAVSLLPAKDSRHIREVYQKISPNLDLSHDFECSSCSYEARLEVPFTADFFWPK